VFQKLFKSHYKIRRTFKPDTKNTMFVLNKLVKGVSTGYYYPVRRNTTNIHLIGNKIIRCCRSVNNGLLITSDCLGNGPGGGGDMPGCAWYIKHKAYGLPDAIITLITHMRNRI
jgi:hypothetical protein